MKLILASSSFNAPEAVKKCVEFVGKPASEINFAVINEAMFGEAGDHSWFLDDMESIRRNFGGRIEFINLLAYDLEKVEERIRAADVIFDEGGNADYLMTVFAKTGFDKLLLKMLKEKVYVGSSAGSMVLGHRPGYKVFADIYIENQSTDKYMDLVGFSVLPHLHSPYFDRKGRIGSDKNAWVLEASKTQNNLVYAISDNAAVIVDGNEVYAVGRDYLIAEKGKIVEEKV